MSFTGTLCILTMKSTFLFLTISQWEIIGLLPTNPEYIPSTYCARAILGFRAHIKYQQGLICVPYYSGVSLNIRKINYNAVLTIVRDHVDALMKQRGPHLELLSGLCCRSFVCGRLGLSAGKLLTEPRFNIIHAPVVEGDSYYYCFLKISRDADWVMSENVPSSDEGSVFVLEQLI